jgi:FixJ family two-component response regulator
LVGNRVGAGSRHVGAGFPAGGKPYVGISTKSFHPRVGWLNAARKEPFWTYGETIPYFCPREDPQTREGLPMTEKITALLIHQDSETLGSLKYVLECQGLRVTEVESHAQAKRMLGGLNPAPLVFTDTELPDGTWTDILAVAERAARPVNVVVVARVVDTRFYAEAIQAGAFDFIAPPLNATDLAHVVRCAVDNVLARRDAQRRPAQSVEDKLVAEVPEPGSQAG